MLEYILTTIMIILFDRISQIVLQNMSLYLLNLSVKIINLLFLAVYIFIEPPNTDLDAFLSKLNNTLDILNKSNIELYLMGDFNINLLNTNSHEKLMTL